MEEKLTPKIFLNKVLAGTATGIIVGLIPNAVLAAILKLFGENTLAVTITQMAVIFQLATPLLIGALIAVQFGFKPMQMLVVAGAAFVGSGVVKFNPDTATYIGAGTGDIINTMITASIAVGMILLIGEKFGSVAIVATPIVVGIGAGLIGYYLYPYVTKITAGAAFVGSGVVKFNPDTATYIGAGTGDIINTMITASIAVGMILLIGEKFGSVAIVATPIVVGIGAGLIGYYLYPYVTKITAAIGDLINTFTTLQPILMSILIACSFAFLIISPISTVAIGMAIQLNGVSAGAAAMGVAATTVVLVVNSWKVNKPGVTLAIALGAMKMMMPNLFRKPIILVPCLFTAIISAIPVALFSVSGTPASAGFGLVGLVGPLASLDAGLSIILLLISWFVVPIVAAFVGQILFEKILKLYDRKDVFEFLG